jgi:hypothetical protein
MVRRSGGRESGRWTVFTPVILHQVGVPMEISAEFGEVHFFLAYLLYQALHLSDESFLQYSLLEGG